MSDTFDTETVQLNVTTTVPTDIVDRLDDSDLELLIKHQAAQGQANTTIARPSRNGLGNDSNDADEDLTQISGVGTNSERTLNEDGYHTVNDLQQATTAELSDTPGICTALAARIKADVGGVTEYDIEDNSKNGDTESELGALFG